MRSFPPEEREEELKTMITFMEMQKSKLTPEKWEEITKQEKREAVSPRF